MQNNSIPATAFKKLNKKRGDGDSAQDEVEAGVRVYDPGGVQLDPPPSTEADREALTGFMNTAVIQSNITFIDGEAGILRYRGYPIEQLAEQSSFLESAFLLLYGELPTKPQFKLFEQEVLHHTYVHRDVEQM